MMRLRSGLRTLLAMTAAGLGMSMLMGGQTSEISKMMALLIVLRVNCFKLIVGKVSESTECNSSCKMIIGTHNPKTMD